MTNSFRDRWQSAIDADDVEGARRLLRSDSGLVHQRVIRHRRDGTTYLLDPLVVACSRDSLAMARLLIEAGADVSARGPDGGVTPLGPGCGPALVDYLLEQGADINGLGYNNSTALMLAAYAGNEPLVAHLMRRGADVNIVQQPYGETALHRATFCSGSARGHKDGCQIDQRVHTRIVQLLVKSGARPNVATTVGVRSHMGPIEWQGEVPLHFAAAWGERDMIGALLAGGADKQRSNARNGVGYRFLGYPRSAH